MSSSESATPDAEASDLQYGYRHEAFLYAGQKQFLEATASFIRAGLAAEEPTLVAVASSKIELLHAELGDQAQDVRFVDIVALGRNPARIIPEWQRFLDEPGGGAGHRGIGEPIWPGRSSAELIESQRHEALLNIAFPGSPKFWLLCPYDIGALDPAVIDEARRSHPFVLENGAHQESADFLPFVEVEKDYESALPEPPYPAREMPFDAGRLGELRAFVALEAGYAGLRPDRIDDLVVAVNEVATNSTSYGGEQGVLRVWAHDGTLTCEVRDDGYMERHPLVGRLRPDDHQEGGRGLWLANSLCDLAQIRSSQSGTAVRLQMGLA